MLQNQLRNLKNGEKIVLLLNPRQHLFYNESGAAITQSVLVRSVDVFAVLRFVFPVMEFLLVWILNNNGMIRKKDNV